MGSMVLTHVAQGIHQDSYRHMMVDNTSPYEEDSDRQQYTSTPPHPSSSSSHPHSQHGLDQPPTPSSPTVRPIETPVSSNSRPQPTVREPSGMNEQPQRSANQSSYYAHNLNQHSRGFDQSGFPLTSEPRGLISSSPSSPRLQPTFRSTRSLGGSEATSPSRIKVRDLSHIQSFASEEYLARPRLGPRTFSDTGRQYEISAMPVTDIIEMVAGLLTKITATNDKQHEHVHRPIPPPEEHGNMTPQTSCVLAFHGKNVPSITILSYLSRIHKYCPTTYEVFLSLLVYFDRMTDMVNRGMLQNPQPRHTESSPNTVDPPKNVSRSPMPMQVDSPARPPHATTPPASDSAPSADQVPQPDMPPSPPVSGGSNDLSQFFVVDSYNIHRLVIAGVTCASKFFSDVFYTNSRYAKVGGLPLVELNHLELQFLLLNDFRLSIPVEELEAYGTMLVEFYAREVIAQQQAAQQHTAHQLSSSQGHDGMYMRDSAASRRSAQATTSP